MLLHKLFWGILAGVPLVTSFNIEEILSKDFIESLPEGNIRGTAQDIGSLLYRHGSLHTDQGPIWGQSDFKVFFEEYLPKLKGLMVAAMENLDFLRSVRDPAAVPSWPHELKAFLELLTSEGSRISVTYSDLTSRLVAAEQNLSSLHEMLELSQKLGTAEFTEEQWRTEASTVGCQVDVGLMVGLAEYLVKVFDSGAKTHQTHFVPVLATGKNLRDMQVILSSYTEKLGPLFSSLRSAAEGLLALDCKKSWIFKIDLPWETFLYTPVENSALSTALDHFRARLLTETILLRLSVAKWARQYPPRLDLSEEQLLNFLAEMTEKLCPAVEELSMGLQSFVESPLPRLPQQLIETPGKQPARQEREIYCRLEYPLIEMLHFMTLLQSRTANASTLNPEARKKIKSAYQVVRKLVESFEAFIRASRQEFGSGYAMDRFLLKLYECSIKVDSLAFAKGIMDYAEEALGFQWASMDSYNWAEFYEILQPAHPQTRVECARVSVVEEKDELPAPDDRLLQKRALGDSKSPEDREPEAKRARREGAGPDED